MKTILFISLYVIAMSMLASGRMSTFNALVNVVYNMRKTAREHLNDFSSDYSPKVDELHNNIDEDKSNVTKEVNVIGNRILSELRFTVALAKEEGKDVRHCYKTAQQGVRSLLDSIEGDLNECVDDSLPALASVLNSTDEVIQGYNDLITDLNDSLVTCFSMDATEMNECLSEKIESAKEVLSSLIERETETRQDYEPALSQTQEIYLHCSGETFAKSNSTALLIDQTAVSCIIKT